MKFIHFGCWNNGLCSSDGNNGLSLTMKKMNNYIKENIIDFITIAGDNYYPSKNIEGKIFNNENFISGFECLPKKIKKYLIFGNHDIEDVINGEKCKSLDEQIKISEEDKTIEIFDNVIYKKVNNTLIIMLDTNLYDREIITTPINKTCYSKLFSDLVNKSSLKIIDLIYNQTCFIKEILENYKTINNIIFIGHHPIYSIKNKKENKSEYKMPRLKNFFIEIQKLLLNKNIYYLCADTHLYQEGTVYITPQLQIKQYIVGTGGAEQDIIFSFSNEIYEDDNLVYKKSVDEQKYGFLVVKIKDSIKFEFISVDKIANKYNKKYIIVKYH
jgi:hypothetical protein